MCGFQSEVRGRGERADSPLSLCRIPKARRISGSSQGHLRKALGNIVESAVLLYPRFSVRGQSITVFTTRPDDPRQPLSFVWEERAEEQAAYEQNARTTWRFRNSYVRLL